MTLTGPFGSITGDLPINLCGLSAMIRRLLTASVAVLPLLAGCQTNPSSPASDSTFGQSSDFPGQANETGRSDQKNYILVVRLHLSSVEVPIGTVSSSEDLWSYLDEEPIEQARGPVLGLNGFRAGVGRADGWPDIARVLKTLTGQAIQESTMLSPPGRPVPVTLKTGHSGQTIFMFRPDGTLLGRDFPPGDNLLTLHCTLNEDDPSEMLVTCTPQVRSSRKGPKFVRSGGGLTMVNRPATFSLAELAFRTRIASGDFLIIGPGVNCERPTSAGHNFLVKHKSGVAYEIVLIARPEVFATQVRTVPAEPTLN